MTSRKHFKQKILYTKTMSKLESEIEATNKLLASLSNFGEFSYIMTVVLFTVSIMISMLYSSKIDTDLVDSISNFFFVLILLFLLVALFTEIIGAFWIVSKSDLENKNPSIDPKLLHTKRYSTTALKFIIIIIILAFGFGIFTPSLLPNGDLSKLYFVLFVAIAFMLIMLGSLFIGIGVFFELNISTEYFLPKRYEISNTSNRAIRAPSSILTKIRKKQFLEIWYIVNIVIMGYLGAPVIREMSNIIISAPSIGVFVLALIMIYLYASFVHTTELVKDA
ncbi:hypothetical protein [Thermococcus sp. ES12]|uniref:hypothetical protein n=1 Tax=Thermococcus sp. ES12 TaxID=1638246 RepID=UPI001430031B|nr:hypothetical protein [Thermococcus sp. ES12]NJE76016.1 hypothetical protein [Thermococcus sp. ES12]